MLGVEELGQHLHEPPSDELQRQILERQVLSPFAAAMLSKLLASPPLAAPLSDRVEALKQLAEVLDDWEDRPIWPAHPITFRHGPSGGVCNSLRAKR